MYECQVANWDKIGTKLGSPSFHQGFDLQVFLYFHITHGVPEVDFILMRIDVDIVLQYYFSMEAQGGVQGHHFELLRRVGTAAHRARPSRGGAR